MFETENRSFTMDWTKEQLTEIAAADDLRISPFREDGKTNGTPPIRRNTPKAPTSRR